MNHKNTEIQEFLAELRHLQIKLWIEDERLRYNAPQGTMTPELLQQIKEKKTEIIAFLKQVNSKTVKSIQPVPRNQELPLSFSQRRLWFIEKTGLSGNAYNMPLTLHLVGKLDLVALQKSLNEIVARHETLRTNFAEINGTPVQVIRPPFELELPQQDLSGLAKSQQTTQLQQCLQTENEKQFNLEVDPPIRVLLLQLGATEHILQVTLHHIASDGWSLTVFAQELSANYTAAVEHQPSTAPELPIQYADFAVWQQEYLQGESLQTELDYWKEKLKELPQLQLPTDYPRPVVETFNGASQSFNLPPLLTSKLKQVSQEQGATLFMTLLAGFKVLLHRYTAQESIAVGVPIANRNRREIEGLIGFFVNSLVMYTDLGGEASFTEVLKRVRQTSLEAYAHQDVPFEKLVAELQPERSLSHNPLFRVSFALLESELANPSFSLPNLEVGWYQGDGAEMTVRMDMELHLWVEGEEIKGFCAYNRDLFAAETISRMLSHYQNLLYAVIETPEQPISLLPMMSSSEEQQLLVTWNNTKTYYPEKCIHELFVAQVEQTPDAIAVVFAEQSLTYSQLNSKANQLAHYLQKLGVVPETLVGICVERSVEMIVGILAILKVGGVYVPLDPSYPQSRLNYLIEDAQLSILLTQEKWLNQLPQTIAQVVCLDTNTTDFTTELSSDITVSITPDHQAYMMYTSGSTGQPKGVNIRHRGVVRLVKNTNYVSFTPQDIYLQLAPISFDAATFEIWGSLLNGGTLVIMPPHKPSLTEIGAAVREHQVTTMWLTAGLFQMMVEEQVEDLASLKQLLAGGDVLSLTSVQKVVAKLEGCQLINGYGPTENTTFTCCFPVKASSKLEKSVPIGRPISNTQVYVLDSHLQPVPIGVPGELHIGGDGLATGYHKRPELTAEKFIANPFEKSKGKLYKTGDLVRYLADGNIEFLGRIDHQVKIRGYRIETGEIEAVLNSYLKVKETVVIAREDKPGDKRLVAYIVPENETSNDTNPELSGTQVDSWQEIFNERIYSELSKVTDPLFNTRGWISNYDGQPIPVRQMRVWAGDIVSQVLASKPERVWEVGCGTGMLLFQIAPHTQEYYGTDISQASLDYIQKQIEQQPEKYGHVTLAQRRAEDMADVAENSFDVVVLSSIVQYFPSVEYLLQVIENSIRVVKPGGMIFLGDIRSNNLMEAFHGSVQIYKATPSLSIEKLKQQIDRVMQQETELLVSPELFVALKEKYQEISHVQIRLQRGTEVNELNKYRYNVLLHIEANPESIIEAPVENGNSMSVADIEAYLKQHQPEAICLTSLVNNRVGNDIRGVELLSQTDSQFYNVQQLRQKLEDEPVNGIEPEELRQLSADLGYSLELCWSAQDNDGCMDAVFVRSELAAGRMVLTPLTQQLLSEENWHGYGNNPLASVTEKQLIPELRQYLESKLPEYMMPSGYMVLSQLPLTPNGKLDRKALPAPEVSSNVSTEFVAPETPMEKALAEIFAGVLGIKQVGIHDNFFELGGHSLLATQVVSRVRQILSIELPLQSLFEKPDIASLAQELEVYRGVETAAITRREDSTNPPPLSFAQQRLWFIEKTGLSSNAYNMPLALHLVGELDFVALQKSLNQMIARHETLRTTFTEINGTPVQIIRSSFELELPKKDLSQLTPSQQVAQLQDLLQTENEQLFDLEVDPPIRALLLQLGAKEHILQVTLHHIASDGWSVTVLTKELSAHYTAALENQPSSLPELPIQYADFAVWQRNYLQGETLKSQLNYWKQKLRVLPQLQLPTDYPRPAVETFNGASIPIKISAALTSKLTQLSQQQGVTLFMTLLAGFKVLMHRYSGQESISIGVPIANRNHREIEGLIGFFVNSLVMYTELAGKPSFTEVLSRVKQTALEAYGHQDLPFEKLVEELQPERSLSKNPLFQVAFALNQSEILQPSFNLPNLEVGWYEGIGAEMTVRVDLELHLWQVGEEIQGFCAYNQDLFEAETISRILSHYENLLSAAVETPDRPISKLPLMTQPELDQILVEWNNTTTDYPTEKCIHQLFEEQVQRKPDAIAVVFEQQKLTYSQLNSKANQLAHYLQKLGVAPETLVGVCVERSVEMVVGLLAILKAGGAYVPLDPAYPQGRLEYMFGDSEVSVLLTQQQLLTQLPQHQAKVVLLDRDWEKIATETPEKVESEVSPQNLAYVIYTSGSTGKPKGVLVEHKGLCNLVTVQIQAFQVNSNSRVLQFASLSFDASIWEIVMALGSGASLYMGTRDSLMPGVGMSQWLHNNKITHITIPPSALAVMPKEELPDLKTIVVAGEACPPELISHWSVRRQFVNAYGPTESTVCATMAECSPECSVPPIGRPIGNTQIYILDRNLQPLPIGVPGEIYIGGIGLARGYLNREILTNQRFIPNPFENSKLYKTGDLGRYLADGNIEFLGRIDHQVKLRGYRIETGEIEATITQHSNIKQTVVVAREDNSGGERLVAYIVPEVENTITSNPELSNTQINSWQNLFNQQIEEQKSEVTDPLFNISGWSSSYDNQSLSESQMRIWAGDIVTQVLAHKPEKVCEIGCGTGLLLFQIAPHTKAYCGIDISSTSLEYIKQQILAEPEKYAHVNLAQKRADEIGEIAGQNFDVVILNSVIQYFPNVEYLLQVISQAIPIVKPGGMILLGDVRNFDLMRAFHTSVQLYQATPSLSMQQLMQQIDRQMQQETELLVSPELFVAIKDKYPEITHVQIRLQRGREYNELNKYRYSVLLHKEAKPTSVIEPPIENGIGMSVQDIEGYLRQQQPDAICLSSLTNNRVANDVAAIDLLSQTEAKLNVQQLKQKLQSETVNGIDPEHLHQLSQDLGYSLELCWSSHEKQGYMDAVFVRSSLAAERIVLTPLTQKSVLGINNWYSYGNNPLASESAKQLIPQLKEHLAERLPEYMLPSGYVVLSQIPLTPNGKIDRKALPALDLAYSRSTEFVAPENDTQKTLAEIWAKVLGIERVGIHDNFFDLGGHSLLATQVVYRVRETFNVELPLQNLFEKPDIESLAKEIEISLGQTQGIETTVIKPREQSDRPLPLSFAQQRLWFLEKTGLSRNAYNMPLALHLEGKLDIVALKESINQIIARHETLRTKFAQINGIPTQIIKPP
ncbi:non-ribosomal peptide synthetase, partial [Okeania sp. SIO1I7]|uniref:non-ribosomal peptide synthetase n=1 Tax=Okeania sp. SIO1I7 TaxID=2607772 RepID=UPI0013FC00D8